MLLGELHTACHLQTLPPAYLEFWLPPPSGILFANPRSTSSRIRPWVHTNMKAPLSINGFLSSTMAGGATTITGSGLNSDKSVATQNAYSKNPVKTTFPARLEYFELRPGIPVRQSDFARLDGTIANPNVLPHKELADPAHTDHMEYVKRALELESMGC